MSRTHQHIAIAVIQDNNGRILIAKRHADKPEGGKWEFPGGKVQDEEDIHGALCREIMEELGIGITLATRLIKLADNYGKPELVLDVWDIDAYRGVATGREQQEIRWVLPGQLDEYDFPELNKAIIMAIKLPDLYCISPEPASPDRFMDRLDKLLNSGIRLLQFRCKTLEDDSYKALARQVIEVCRQHNTTVVLNSEPELVLELGADGVHMTSERCLELKKRPLGRGYLVSASCHNKQELLHASELGCDFAVLSPVKPTATHPGTDTLGWAGFEAIVSGINMPVYALGGMKPDDIGTARAHGAQGVAMLSGLWVDPD